MYRHCKICGQPALVCILEPAGPRPAGEPTGPEPMAESYYCGRHVPKRDWMRPAVPPVTPRPGS